MNKRKYDIIDSTLQKGRSLEDAGVKNWGLTKPDALAAIEIFYANQILILGGDVYRVVNGQIEPCYDNWLADLKRGESMSSMIEKGYNISKEYVTGYAERDEVILFALVVSPEDIYVV